MTEAVPAGGTGWDRRNRNGNYQSGSRSIGNIPGRSVAGGYRGGGYERPHGLYEGRKDKKRAE